jgi:hypothetical protein
MDSKYEKAAVDLVQRMMTVGIPREVSPPIGKRPRAWIEDRNGQVYICFWPGGDPLQLRVIDMIYPLVGTIPEGASIVWWLQYPHLTADYSAANEPAAYVYAAALAVSSMVKKKTFLAPLVPHIQHNDIIFNNEGLLSVPIIPNWVYRAQFVERTDRPDRRNERDDEVFVDPETLKILPGRLLNKNPLGDTF